MQAAAIAEQVQAFFHEYGWKFECHELHQGSERAETYFSMGMGLSNGNVHIVTHIQNSRLAFFCALPFCAPEARRGAMAEAITRANYGLTLGNFEMDFRDGELRYRTSMDTANGELTRAMVACLYGANTGTVNRYLPALQMVAMSEANPALAIEAVEGGRYPMLQQLAAQLDRAMSAAAEGGDSTDKDEGEEDGAEENPDALSRLLELLSDVDLPGLAREDVG